MYYAKRVKSLRAHLRVTSFAGDTALFKEMLQRRQQCIHDLTRPRFEFQTIRFCDKRAAARRNIFCIVLWSAFCSITHH